MAYLLIADRFYQAPEVLDLDSRELGIWVRMASYHARWPKYDIHPTIAKQCGARHPDLHRLVAAGWLVEGEDGWRLGHGDTGLWKIGSSTTDSRPARQPIPHEVRAAVFDRDGRNCLFCDATADLTLDHIIPYSHGGPDTVENLRVLCRRCNSIRGNRVEADL